MIQIGVRGHDYGKDIPERLCQRISGDGFSSLQLAFKKAITGVDQFSDITPSVVKEVKQALEKYKLHTAVLGVYINPSLVTDNTKRESDVAEFIGSIPFAKELGADCIGTETTSINSQPDVTRDEALKALYRSLWKIMPVAEASGVMVAIEPVQSHTVNTPELAKEVLKTVASPNLKIIFDPVNMLSVEELHTQDQLWGRTFECLGEKITAVHMKGIFCDNNNKMSSCDFQHSMVNYQFIFRHLRQLPQSFSILREEANPSTGADDCRFLKSMIQG